MSVRITNLSLNSGSVSKLNGLLSNLSDLQTKISSQKEINKPSDNAISTSKILTINSQLDKIGVYNTNISTAQEQISTMEGALSSVTDQLQRVYELTVQASNQTYSGSNLSAIKEEIGQITASIIDFSNTQYNGQYIFSGNNTGQPAYTMGSDGSIVYNGSNSSTDEATRSIEIMDGVYVSLNINGGDIFGNYDATTDPDNPTGSGIFGTLGALSDLLGTTPPDYDAIASQLSPLKQGIDDISNANTRYAAASASRLDMTTSYLSDLTLSLKEQKSNLEDLDIVEAATKLSTQTYAYQASLKAINQTMNLSLLDYM